MECISVVFRFNRFFIKFPEHQNVFANYKDKAPASLKSMDVFKVHITKVVTLLVAILEKADDPVALKAECEKLAKMQPHVDLNIQHFKVRSPFCNFLAPLRTVG